MTKASPAPEQAVPAIVPGASFHNGAFEQSEPTSPMHEDICRYIRDRLGPELSKVYIDAIASSVALGIYDDEWMTSSRPKIERYLQALYKDFTDKHQDKQYLLHRLLVKLEYGSDEEKSTLKKLLAIE